MDFVKQNMYLYILFLIVLLTTSQAAPYQSSALEPFDDDPAMTTYGEPYNDISISADPNFPISDPTTLGSLPTENNLPLPQATDPNPPLNLPEEPDLSQQEDDPTYQVAKVVPLSDPLYASCNLWSTSCTICRRQKSIPLVCEIAEKTQRDQPGDTLCVTGSRDKCVYFNSVFNSGINAEASWWDASVIDPHARDSSLPDHPGEMKGFCRRVDINLDCRICTRSEQEDCAPASLKRESDVTYLCNEQAGCTRYDD